MEETSERRRKVEMGLVSAAGREAGGWMDGGSFKAKATHNFGGVSVESVPLS